MQSYRPEKATGGRTLDFWRPLKAVQLPWLHALRERQQETHPDRPGGDTEAMLKLTGVGTALKRHYDEQRH